MSLIPSTTVQPEHVSLSRLRRPRLTGDARDAQLGVRLAVAADAVPALLLRAEVPELAALAVRDHFGLHPGARDQRLPQLHVAALADQQHFEIDLRAHVLRELLHLEEVAFLDAVLFSARPDHCVHRKLHVFRLGTGPAGKANPPPGAERNGRSSGSGSQSQAIALRAGFPTCPPGRKWFVRTARARLRAR